MNETITKLQEVFAPIAEKIGQGAEFGWEVVVKQQQVEAYIDIFSIVIGIVLTILGFYLAKKSDWDTDVPKVSEISACLLLITSTSVIVIGTADFVFEGLGQLVNPEYYAIQFFLNLVK